MGSGASLGTAYYELIPSMRGAQQQISEKLNPAARAAGDSAGSSLGSMLLGGIKRYAAPIAAIAAGFSIAKVVKDSQAAFMDLAGTTRTLSRIAGGTTEQVSALAGGMRMAGLDADRSQVALTVFSKNLGNAAGDSKKAADMVAKLGGEFRDAQGNVKPMSEILPVLADRFKSMPNGAEKTALAMQLFGRSGAQVIPFLNNGSAGITEFTTKAREMGLVLDDTSMKIWSSSRTSLREYKAAVDGAKASLGQNLVPIVVAVQNVYRSAFIPVLQAATGWLQAHRDMFIQVGGVISAFATRVGGAITGLLALVTKGDFTAGLRQSLGLNEDSAIVGGILAIRSAFVGLGDAVKIVFAGITGGQTSAALGALTGPLTTLGQSIRSVWDGVGGIFKQLMPVFSQLAPQVLELWSSFSPLSIILQALTPVLPQLASMLGQVGSAVGGALSSALTQILPPLLDVAKVLSGALMQAFSAVMPVIGDLIPVVVQIADTLGGVLATAVTAVAPIIATVAQLIAQLVPVIMPVITAVLSLISPILGLITPLLRLVGPILDPLIQLLSALLVPIIGLIAPLVQLLAPALEFVAQVLGTVVGWVATALDWFVRLVTGNKEAGDQFMGVWNSIMGFFGGVGKFFADTWQGLINGITQFMVNVVEFFQGIPNRIRDVFTGAGDWLFNIGRDLINGLLNGAGSLLRTIGDFFLSILPGWIVDPFKAALGIHSPSRVFEQLGQFTMQGYVEGIGGMQDRVAAATVAAVSVPSAGTAQAGISRVASGARVQMDVTVPMTDPLIQARVLAAETERALAS